MITLHIYYSVHTGTLSTDVWRTRFSVSTNECSISIVGMWLTSRSEYIQRRTIQISRVQFTVWLTEPVLCDLWRNPLVMRAHKLLSRAECIQNVWFNHDLIHSASLHVIFNNTQYARIADIPDLHTPFHAPCTSTDKEWASGSKGKLFHVDAVVIRVSVWLTAISQN